MHQLANRELTLLGLGAVAVVLVLSTLGASGSTGRRKIHSPVLRPWTACPRLLIRAMSTVRLERDISALQ